MWFFFGLKGFCQGICYRLGNYLPMLVSHSIVSASFCFNTSLIHYDRCSFFGILDIALIDLDLASPLVITCFLLISYYLRQKRIIIQRLIQKSKQRDNLKFMRNRENKLWEKFYRYCFTFMDLVAICSGASLERFFSAHPGFNLLRALKKPKTDIINFDKIKQLNWVEANYLKVNKWSGFLKFDERSSDSYIGRYDFCFVFFFQKKSSSIQAQISRFFVERKTYSTIEKHNCKYHEKRDWRWIQLQENEMHHPVK